MSFNERFADHMESYSPSVELELRELAERSMGSISIEGIAKVLDILNPPQEAEVIEMRQAA